MTQRAFQGGDRAIGDHAQAEIAHEGPAVFQIFAAGGILFRDYKWESREFELIEGREPAHIGRVRHECGADGALVERDRVETGLLRRMQRSQPRRSGADHHKIQIFVDAVRFHNASRNSNSSRNRRGQRNRGRPRRAAPKGRFRPRIPRPELRGWNPPPAAFGGHPRQRGTQDAVSIHPRQRGT